MRSSTPRRVVNARIVGCYAKTLSRLRSCWSRVCGPPHPSPLPRWGAGTGLVRVGDRPAPGPLPRREGGWRGVHLDSWTALERGADGLNRLVTRYDAYAELQPAPRGETMLL